ncbi:Protein ssh4 [Conoideocrella luteorostrata]|uniref:Protein SSH4 n=1 Tax=Conoideocrella luteorostrata TaxID=1105319 RepID=A0AAJ0G051_9HYPO|nr:Protein ssh4 [Conoideocrella luteorostrata]
MKLVEPPSSAFTGVLIGLVSSFGSIILIALVVFIFWASGCAGSGRILLDRLGRPGEYDDEQAFAREEAEALESMDVTTRREYMRAKDFVTAHPPESLPTDISLSQYLAIQEKGVEAWEFEPELQATSCSVEERTVITFSSDFYDPQCTVMTNLPVPKQNEVYYWEVKVFEKPEDTLLSIGMATKPYPPFRLPGYHKYSVAYFSDGSRHYNQPFNSTPYGEPLATGDIIGVGYRPRTGAIFFTKNGKRYPEVVHGLKSQNFFPAIGATGPSKLHVNLGKEGFVFIEANVKKWGLAPAEGNRPPPPPYGVEQGSILLETGTKYGTTTYGPGRSHRQSVSGSPYTIETNSNSIPGHGRTRSGNFRALPPTSPGPVRSPTDISLAQMVPNDDVGEASSSVGATNDQHQEEYHSENQLHLHLEDATNPPPDYASPPHSDSGDNRRYSIDSDEETPLIRVMNTDRTHSSGTVTPRNQPAGQQQQQQQQPPRPPVPSYSDAVRDGAIQQPASSESESESSDSSPS